VKKPRHPLYEPLPAQDASFVLFEHRATHMHVAVLAVFEIGPLRSTTGGVDAARLLRYGQSQLAELPRGRFGRCGSSKGSSATASRCC